MKEKEKQNKTKGGKILKPIAIAGLSLAMACSLSACGKNKSGNKDPEVPAIIWTADNAYTQAKAEGFTGTFEEFLATLAGITKVETDSTGHLKVTLSDGSVVDAGKVTGDKGEKGDKGSNGQDGVSVTSIIKTSSNGLVDTYTITLSNGQTQTFTITNGRDGQNGVNGVNGKDGKDGEKGDKGDDGISITSVTSTSDRWGLITTTIYNYSDGNHDTIITDNGVQFGRLYDIKTESELNYLLSNGVTNFAFLSNITLSNSIVLNETESAIYKNIIPIDSNKTEGHYFNYNFNLNGYTLSAPTGTTITTDERSTVLFENGNLAMNDNSFVVNNPNGIMITNDVNLQYTVWSVEELKAVASNKDLAGMEIFLGDDLTFTADNLGAKYFYITNNLTINFNNHSITAEAYAFNIAGESTNVTLKNGRLETARHGVWLKNHATLTVEEDMTIKSNTAQDDESCAIVVVSGSTLNFYGKASADKTVISGNGTGGNGAITINVFEGAELLSENGAAIYMPNNDTLNISGGSISGRIGLYVRSGSTTISGETSIFGKGEKEEFNPTYGGYNLTGDAIVIDTTITYPAGAPTIEIGNDTRISSENAISIAYYTNAGSSYQAKIRNNSKFEVSKNDISYIIKSDTISSDIKTAAGSVIQEINSKAYNNKTKLGDQTKYTLTELNEALGEDALSTLYVEYANVTLDNYKLIMIDDDIYFDGQEIELSIGNANYIKDKAYYVENGKLYINAIILATASTEAEPYTIASLTAPTGMNVTKTSEKNVYNVEITSGTNILYVEINGTAKEDLFLRKQTSNGVTSFGFTTTDQIPDTNKFSYGIYPLGWCEDISVYAGLEFTVEYDLYIIGKGTVHLTINYSVPQA